MVVMPKPSTPNRPVVGEGLRAGSFTVSEDTALQEIEAKLAASITKPAPEEMEAERKEAERIAAEEIEAQRKAPERIAAEEEHRARIEARQAEAEEVAEHRRQAQVEAQRRLEQQAAKKARSEVEAQAQALHAQRETQARDAYTDHAAAKIQARVRGKRARRAAKERMAKVELSRDEKAKRMVDNVFRSIRQHLKSDRKLYGKALADAGEVFRVMDKDGSGALTDVEFGEALRRMGFGLTPEQVEAVVRFVDSNGDGEVDYNEYITLIAKGDPDLANTEEAHIIEARRRATREKRKEKRRVAAKKAAQMRQESALNQRIMTADERVAYLDARASRYDVMGAAAGSQTSAPEQPQQSQDAQVVSETLDSQTSAPEQPQQSQDAQVVSETLDLADQPVKFGEDNWMPHQHSFDADTSGFGFDVEPELPREPTPPSRGACGHRSWREWYRANEGQVSQLLVPKKKEVSTDTAEVKVLKDKFKALVYGRNKDPASLLFRKFDPNGDGSLDLEEFTEAVRRNWKGKSAPLTKRQILKMFKACDVDGSGEIDMLELAEFVWGKDSAEVAQARILMESGDWHPMSPRSRNSAQSPPETPRLGPKYLAMKDVSPDADGPPPTMQETLELRSKLKQASYTRGGQNPAGLFRKFDADGSGELDLAEFIQAIRKGGKMNKDQMSDRDIRQLFRLIDGDGGGEISIDELTAYVWGDQGFTKPERDAKDDVAPESFATVRQAFFGTSQGQLNVARGDVVTIKDRKGVWCSVRDHSTGRTGLVPAAYINMPPPPGTKRPSKGTVLARLTQQSQKSTDTGLLIQDATSARSNREYWRTIAVPLEAHIAAARKGLFVPDMLQGAREFFSTHGDMQKKLAQPAPARGKKLSQLATPRGGTAALARMRAELQARQEESDSTGTPKMLQMPQPPSTRKPVLGTPLSCRAKPSPRRRLRSLKGSESERAATERRQRPQDFGADTYVGQATVKSLRTQVIERKVKVPSESTVELRSAEELARRLNEQDARMAEVAARRKHKLEQEQFEAQFDAQLIAAKRELHSKRLQDEQENVRRSAREAKHIAQQEAATRRREKVRRREEQMEHERIEYNKVKAANAQAKAEEERMEQIMQQKDRRLARDELNFHIAKEQERRATKHRGTFGAAPEGWRSLKKNEKAFRKIKGEAKRLVQHEQEVSRKVGPIRQRKLAALYQEFNVVPKTNGSYPRHTMPELVHALDTIAKGDLRVAVAYLTEEGAPTWAATKIQARLRGNIARMEVARWHRGAVTIQARARGMSGRVRGRQYMKHCRAARVIQARQRGIMVRQRVLAQRAAAIRIETAERGRQARMRRRRLLEQKYATILQQLCRRRFARQQLHQQRTAATLIQRSFRGCRTRRIIKALQAETHWYTAVKKATAQLGADEKSKKIPSSEGSVIQPGDRVLNTLESRAVSIKNSNVRIARVKFTLSSGTEGWLSVKDKKGNTLLTPIHRWLVRGKPTAATAGKCAMEGKLRWKHPEVSVVG